MKVLSDIIAFLKTITFVDYVFFFAVVALMILVITLIYFIKINDEVFVEEKEDKKKDELKEITQKLINDHPKIECDSYEKEQEDKAIISYDELLKKSKIGTISYDDEEDLGDLKVKKITVNNYTESNYDNKTKVEPVRVISYQKEEDFLDSLKKLQSLLN